MIDLEYISGVPELTPHDTHASLLVWPKGWKVLPPWPDMLDPGKVLDGSDESVYVDFCSQSASCFTHGSHAVGSRWPQERNGPGVRAGAIFVASQPSAAVAFSRSASLIITGDMFEQITRESQRDLVGQFASFISRTCGAEEVLGEHYKTLGEQRKHRPFSLKTEGVPILIGRVRLAVRTMSFERGACPEHWLAVMPHRFAQELRKCPNVCSP